MKNNLALIKNRIKEHLDRSKRLRRTGLGLGINPFVPFVADPVGAGRHLGPFTISDIVESLTAYSADLRAFINDTTDLMREFDRVTDSLDEEGRLDVTSGDVLEPSVSLTEAAFEAGAAFYIAMLYVCGLPSPFVPEAMGEYKALLEAPLEGDVLDAPGGEMLRQRLDELQAYVRAVAPGVAASRPGNGTSGDGADFGWLFGLGG
jgi:hypothetical protein